MENDDKLQICKLVALLIMIDTKLKDSEVELLNKLMDRYGLSDAQKQEVLRRNIDEDPATLASPIKDIEAQRELIDELVSAAAIDGEVVLVERKLIHRVAAAIGLGEQDVEERLTILD